MRWVALAAGVFVAAVWLGGCGTRGRAVELDVLSYNIRYGTAEDGENAWVLRREVAIDVLGEDEPAWDIAGMQEVLKFQLDEIAARHPEYAIVGVGRNDGVEAGEFSPILFDRRRLRAVDSGTFWLSDTPEVPGSMGWGNRITRICTWALLEERSGARVWVFNTHLDHQSAESRERSVELIAARMGELAGEGPVILTGDLNAGEDSPPVRYLLGEIETASGEAPASPGLVDAFRAVHPGAEEVGTFNGFRGASDGAKIDYVMVSEGVVVLEAGIDREARQGRWPSDHFPVWARVVVGQETERQRD